ncbi:MAG: ferredoxin [Verrucomicrobia bacterium]|nr:ferredoxin [Verrucomicrobiota bacterium]
MGSNGGAAGGQRHTQVSQDCLEERVRTYNVTFLPEGKTVQAAAGKSLLDAAMAAGVSLRNVCQGDGICGKCRVLVKSGSVSGQPDMFLTRNDIQRGVALACRTLVENTDVVVEVPQESRVDGAPQLAFEDAVRYGGTAEAGMPGALFQHDPLVHKEYLHLEPPSPGDNMPDLERLYRALRRNHDIPTIQAGLSVLKRLPGVLRKSDWKVTVVTGQRGGTVEVIDVEPGDTSRANCAVAVDLGTTTVVAHLVDPITSETLATKAKYNSQIPHGDDVIARMMYASSPENLARLQALAVNDINDLIAAMVVECHRRLADVTFVVCAGNTTMIHLLLGLDPGNIRRDPYVPCVAVPPAIRAAEIGIKVNPRGLLMALPGVSSYVGSDVVADVLACRMTTTKSLSLLIDMGTNGELVIGNEEWLMCCSASAGPAFEGGGISCGMRATDGAIEQIRLGKRGVVESCRVVGGGKPLGICGSGLIDAVGELLKAGCIDRRGRFVANVCGSRLRESENGGLEFVLVPGEDTSLGRDIVLTEPDISNLIHTKGSIYMAAECLLAHAGLSFDDMENLYIAGGFGSYLNIERGIAIGLLPDVDRSRFHVVGNGSVQGAKTALLSRDALRYMQDRIVGITTDFDLSSDHTYMNGYSSCLFLPHTDIEKFPSQKKIAEEVAV